MERHPRTKTCVQQHPKKYTRIPARLTVLHVVEEPASTREAEDRLGEIYTDRMKRFMPAESENWCKVDFRLEFGAPVEAILGEARKTGADLIVMGAKARKALAGHRPRSIAYNVVTRATCPVLTVRGLSVATGGTLNRTTGH
jgi:nucleotide-binding universal stress UspA family protein